MPLVEPLSQFASTNFGTSLVMSGPTEKRDVVGLLAGGDGLALRAARAVGGRELTPLPAVVLRERRRERVVGRLRASRSATRLTVLLSLRRRRWTTSSR